MRAVLDTNVVIDLLHFADPPAQALHRAIRCAAVQCFADQPCLAELERVAGYPRRRKTLGRRQRNGLS